MNIEEKARELWEQSQYWDSLTDKAAKEKMADFLSTFRDEVLEEVAHLAFRTESDTFAEFAVELRKLKSQPIP